MEMQFFVKFQLFAEKETLIKSAFQIVNQPYPGETGDGFLPRFITETRERDIGCGAKKMFDGKEYSCVPCSGVNETLC